MKFMPVHMRFSCSYSGLRKKLIFSCLDGQYSNGSELHCWKVSKHATQCAPTFCKLLLAHFPVCIHTEFLDKVIYCSESNEKLYFEDDEIS